MKKVFFFFVFATLNYSCRMLKTEGDYQFNDRLKIATGKLKLNSDSSFEYHYEAGDVYTISASGRWHISANKKYVVLNSNLKSDSDLITVVERKDPKLTAGLSRFAVYDSESSPFYAYLVVNPSDSLIKFSDTNRLDRTKDYNVNPIHKFALTYLGIAPKVIVYEVNDLSANEFEIKLELSPYTKYRYFNNTEWRVKRNKLLDLDSIYNIQGQAIYVKH